MTEDLEGLLRRTLAERAGTVKGGAILPQPSVVTPIRRRRTWLAPAAAAAAVVVGVTVGTTSIIGKEPRSGVGAGGEVCPARPSSAFERAYAKHPTPLGDTPALVTLLGPTLGRDHLIVTAESPSRVYQVTESGQKTLLLTAPAGQQVTQVEASGRWMIAITALPRTDDVGNPASTSLAVLDTASGKRTVLASSAVTTATANDVLQPRFDSLVVTHGSAYWITRPRSDSLIATAHRYELASGRTTDLGSIGGYRGPGQDIKQVRPVLLKTDAGVAFGAGGTATRTLVRFAEPKLPPVVAKAFHRQYPTESVRTDGKAYAWSPGKDVLYWRSGLTHPQRFRNPTYLSVVDVNGPFVALATNEESSHDQLLDTRTGAVLDLSDTSREFRHVYLGARLGAKVLERPPFGRVTELYRVVASDLPELRC